MRRHLSFAAMRLGGLCTDAFMVYLNCFLYDDRASVLAAARFTGVSALVPVDLCLL